ncbi:hypothetical protein L7F22_054906 [Adiantum nelumboides]|nr:hypothetical protein [Adiantum nelumboides]
MALVNGADDQWRPSLAPIRTTVTPACTHASHKETHHPIQQPHRSNDDAAPTVTSTSSPPSPEHGCPDSRMPIPGSPCRSINKLSCVHLLPNCFSCFHPRQLPSTSPRCPRRRRCMHRKRLHDLRSLSFLFPAAGRMQSFYSSTPTAKAQLSGTFPHTPSGKLEQYMSPRIASAATLTSQTSGKFSQFSSPRTPTSSKVQHFSGAIPSPRTPYGPSVVTSPACTRRKTPTFTLVVPPGMMDKKKAFEQIDAEPSSPHVTCIGRVRRQTQCKKLLHSDAIDPGNRRRQGTKAQPKGTTISSSKHKFFTDLPLIDRNELKRESKEQGQTTEMSSATEQPSLMLEACTQRFGKKKLRNLSKIQAYGHETNYAYNNVLFQANRYQGMESEERESAPCKESHKPQVSVHNNKYSMQTECIQGAVGIPPEHSGADAASTKIQVQERTSSCMQVGYLVNDGHGDGDGEQRSAETYPQTRHILLLMRNTGSRRYIE